MALLINPDIQMLAEAIQRVNWETLEGFTPRGFINQMYEKEILENVNYQLTAYYTIGDVGTVKIKLIDKYRGLWIESVQLLADLQCHKNTLPYDLMCSYIDKINNYHRIQDLN